MALSDEDRDEIGAMIAEAVTSGRDAGSRSGGTARRPAARATSDYDSMSSNEQRLAVRELVDERLSQLDQDYEVAELRKRNKELEAARKEWEEQGRKGKRPTRPASEQTPAERRPTLVGKGFKFLFGQPEPTDSQ